MVKTKVVSEPDIAFWFDKKIKDRFMVRVNKELSCHQLILACFDLLVKALEKEKETVEAEWEEE
jgi:hypothetical protein